MVTPPAPRPGELLCLLQELAAREGLEGDMAALSHQDQADLLEQLGVDLQPPAL